ncbi:class I SAM-dependent methyltransferase [Roseibacterium sp. SDUM158016]|uniref:class I SAM-dependent methyltransferase n=1 Tax=Roseicyclus sediminis TaxID=2980997 RepID=UPI0021D05E55|nr:class I SAM-dependent methyltransferase [Roseibacterium sp. SDUM158016]MCU4653930.1 class I SAM-dependent methyltransferase [Roseibacterium sp. SDUM158016]
MTPRKTCPACGGSDLRALYHLPAIPSQSVVLLDTREEAVAYPKGELTLTLCQGCGFMFNATFDAGLVDYSSTTEESQHFSGTFNRFAKDLAAEIAGRQDLDGRLILEIGCGKGDFLEELVDITGAQALGVDPGFIPERLPGAAGRRIRFLREYFDPDRIKETPDLIVCRHTLEHIPEVGRFMEDVMAVTHGRDDVQVMFETPDAARVLAEGAFWDIYHEHCSYFTLGCHARLFRAAGLNVTKSYLAYGDQYIIQYAEPGQGEPHAEERDLETTLALAEAFPARIAETRAFWLDKVQAAHSAGRATAIWGGGSKAVAFLTTNGLGAEIGHVIDINLHKQGKYLPGTGHVVSAPAALAADPPDTVIVMNPVYVEEIRTALADMELRPEIVAL